MNTHAPTIEDARIEALARLLANRVRLLGTTDAGSYEVTAEHTEELRKAVGGPPTDAQRRAFEAAMRFELASADPPFGRASV